MDGVAEQLSKLAKLHADGVLTDDEFKALKKKLIVKSVQAKHEPHSQPAGIENENNDFTNQPLLAQLQEWSKTNPVLAWGGVLIVCVLGAFLIVSYNANRYSQTTTEQTNRLIFQHQEIQRSVQDQQFQNGLRRDFETAGIENQQLQDRMKRDRDDQLRALTAPR
jgi:Short C-terminal domain